MTGTRKTIPQASDRPVGVSGTRLGADQYVQLTTCIGYYAMLAMTVNGVELPPGGTVLLPVRKETMAYGVSTIAAQKISFLSH